MVLMVLMVTRFKWLLFRDLILLLVEILCLKSFSLKILGVNVILPFLVLKLIAILIRMVRLLRELIISWSIWLPFFRTIALFIQLVGLLLMRILGTIVTSLRMRIRVFRFRRVFRTLGGLSTLGFSLNLSTLGFWNSISIYFSCPDICFDSHIPKNCGQNCV